MELFETIDKRRSVRNYLPKTVSEEDLKEILEALRKAPSAKNLQPLKFIIITDKSIQQQLIPACRNQNFLAEAPILIAGCANENECYTHMGEYMKSFAIDLTIAFDHFTLAARAKGLGTCWIGAFNEKEVKKILKVPQGIRVVALSPLGYPNQWPETKTRRSLSELICYNSYK